MPLPAPAPETSATRFFCFPYLLAGCQDPVGASEETPDGRCLGPGTYKHVYRCDRAQVSPPEDTMPHGADATSTLQLCRLSQTCETASM